MATDSETFAKIFASITGINVNLEENKWAYQLYDIAAPLINSGQIQSNDALLYDIILAEDKAPQAYKDRFSAVTKLKAEAPDMAITVAEYLKQERQYITLLKGAGMSNLANYKDVKKFFENQVSYDEAASRINIAYSAIDSADEFTKAALSERFPTLNKSDLAQGLLLGKDGAAEIEKKAIASQVAGSALAAGYRTKLTDAELVASGLGTSISGRNAAREAYARVAAQESGIRQAAATFGTTSTDIVKETEKQAILGSTSTEANRLRSQARAQFGGTSGITTGSLGRRKQV